MTRWGRQGAAQGPSVPLPGPGSGAEIRTAGAAPLLLKGIWKRVDRTGETPSEGPGTDLQAPGSDRTDPGKPP